MKILSITLAAILLLSTLNVAFSQTSDSSEQCQTVMHEQIVQKKVNGKLRLEKIQVPMKICKDPNIKTESTKPSKPQYKKIDNSVQQLVDSGKEIIKVSIRGNGAVPDFRPTKPSSEYYAMSDLTPEQRNEISAKSKAYVKELQKDLVKFITDNGGKVTYQSTLSNLLFVEVPAGLVKELEKRTDISKISNAERKYVTKDSVQSNQISNNQITNSNSTDQCQILMHEQIVQKKVDGKIRLQKIQVPMKICKDPNIKIKLSPSPRSPTPHKKISDDLQKLVDSGQERIRTYISVNGTVPDFRPTKSSGEYYAMAELTQEQRKEVTVKRTAYVKELQKDLVKFMISNDGKILSKPYPINILYAEVPAKLLKDLEKRNDVLDMDRGDQKVSIPHLIYKDDSKKIR
ncbi:MAG: hypothetical protein HZA84_08745 [Thaumarchaeota archaeon]|nr:hypothetical protein [Nitrososphaerota archaeon]